MVHNPPMRRALSAFFVVLLGLAPLAFVFSASTDANLPACCRRHGTHHCTMFGGAANEQSSTRTSSFTGPSHCPLFPRHGSAAPAPIFALTAYSFAFSIHSQPANLIFPPSSGASSIQSRVLTLRGPPKPISF